MANKRKIFQSDPSTQHNSTTGGSSQISPTAHTDSLGRVEFAQNSKGRTGIDYSAYSEKGVDKVAIAIQSAISEAVFRAQERPDTIVSWADASKVLLRYCIEQSAQISRPIELSDLTTEFVKNYISWLSSLEGISYETQSNYYKKTKSVLVLVAANSAECVQEHELPARTHPTRNRAKKQKKYYSRREWKALITALRAELKIIFNSLHEEPTSETLSILLLALAIRTGRNLCPMLDLGRDAIIPSPFKKDQALLATHKYRGNATNLLPLRWSESQLDVAPLLSDGVAIYELVKSITSALALSGPEFGGRLWLFRRNSYGKQRRTVTTLHTKLVLKYAKVFAKRYNLRSDDGSLMTINVSLIRRTWVNRMANLSGGDLFAVSKLAGHSLKVSEGHYLDISDELIANHKIVVEDIHATFSSQGMKSSQSASMTRVGRCRDPLNGSKRPKEEAGVCVNFSQCFRCNAFVVTKDDEDLHRLYSYYWFAVHERNRISSRQWAKYYRYTIKLIDEQIAPQIGLERAERIKSHAKKAPHPFWRPTSEEMSSHEGT